MTPAEVQQLDEALTAAGHDPECAAFVPGAECSCGCEDGVPVIETPPPRAPVVASGGRMSPSEAKAYSEFKAAAAAIKMAAAAYEAAQARYRAAIETLSKEAAK